MFWMFWTIFLLFGRSLAKEKEEDDISIVKNLFIKEKLRALPPLDFRCWQAAFSRFSFSEYSTMYYKIEPTSRFIGCSFPFGDDKHIFYPTPTGLDPMMEFYIHKIHEMIPLVETSPEEPIDLPTRPLREKQFCMDLRMIGTTFVEYLETFHSDDQTCWKIEEIAKKCYTFREMWFSWVRSLYDKLCLDEDGCYNVMELYEDDMPHCVKYVANRQFQNASFGSWHHSIANYCQLTDLVPEAKHANYDKSILFEDGKTEDDLLTMCQFLRFRLLPEEGKEDEIREITLDDRSNSNIGRDTGIDSAAFGPASRSCFLTLMFIYGL